MREIIDWLVGMLQSALPLLVSLREFAPDASAAVPISLGAAACAHGAVHYVYLYRADKGRVLKEHEAIGMGILVSALMGLLFARAFHALPPEKMVAQAFIAGLISPVTLKIHARIQRWIFQRKNGHAELKPKRRATDLDQTGEWWVR